MTAPLLEIQARLTAAVRNAPPGREAANELALACEHLLGLDGAAMSMVVEGVSHGTFGASNESGRRLDEYQFTFGEGPCLDAVAERRSVSAPDLRSATERRWPMFAEAALGEGVRAVFALPIIVTSACVGALDLFRATPGELHDDQLEGARLAARLAAAPLMHLVATDGASTRMLEDGEGYEDDQGGGPGGGLSGMDRVEVYQATGMLIAQLDVSAEEAAVRLRAYAMSHGLTASEVAVAIIERGLLLEGDGPQDRQGRSRP